eukprot:jgi/Botrbrau1/11603/Bobra.247_1s0017.2
MDASKQYWDPKYEFNAPRFYDFATQNDDSDGDVWFDSVETAGLRTPASRGKTRKSSDEAPSSRPKDLPGSPLNACSYGKENVSRTLGKKGISGLISRMPKLFIKTPLFPRNSNSLVATASAKEGQKEGKQHAPSAVAPIRERAGKRMRNHSHDEPGGDGKDTQQNTISRQDGKFAVLPPRDHTFPKAKRARMIGPQGDGKEVWKPLALQVAQFESNLACRSCVNTRSKPGKEQLHVTEPKEITFATDRRMRGSKYKSREDEEAEAMRMKSPFKARAVRKSILNGTSAQNLPSTTAKPLTRPETPCLATRHRAAQHTASEMGGSEAHVKPFQAQRLNPAILQGPTFIPTRSHAVPTQPHSPWLSTRLRNRGGKQEDGSFSLGAPPTSQKRLTPTADRSRSRQQARRKHPMLTRSQKKAPRTLVQNTVTIPTPFHLESLGRHEKAAADRERQHQVDLERARRGTEFKAQPMHIPAQPFVPARSSKPPTRPKPIALAVVTRSVERAKFDDQVAQKEAAQQVTRNPICH